MGNDYYYISKFENANWNSREFRKRTSLLI